MPRHARKKSSTNTYHVVVKGADNQLLFEDPKDYEKYMELLIYYKERCKFELFAYCIMSNHVHLLLRHSQDGSLESIFRHLNTAYSTWFNMKYNRTGYLQDGRYYSEPVEDERYLISALRYIHFNPSKAGLETAPGVAYPWSSYYEYISFRPLITDISFIYNILGGKEQFLLLHSIPAKEHCLDIEQIRKRIPDDVAKDIIFNTCECNSVADFQKLTLSDRDKYLVSIHKKGVSIRQLNRLTGTPRGVIERILRRS